MSVVSHDLFCRVCCSLSGGFVAGPDALALPFVRVVSLLVTGGLPRLLRSEKKKTRRRPYQLGRSRKSHDDQNFNTLQ